MPGTTPPPATEQRCQGDGQVLGLTARAATARTKPRRRRCTVASTCRCRREHRPQRSVSHAPVRCAGAPAQSRRASRRARKRAATNGGSGAARRCERRPRGSSKPCPDRALFDPAANFRVVGDDAESPAGSSCRRRQPRIPGPRPARGLSQASSVHGCHGTAGVPVPGEQRAAGGDAPHRSGRTPSGPERQRTPPAPRKAAGTPPRPERPPGHPAPKGRPDAPAPRGRPDTRAPKGRGPGAHRTRWPGPRTALRCLSPRAAWWARQAQRDTRGRATQKINSVPLASQCHAIDSSGSAPSRGLALNEGSGTR